MPALGAFARIRSAGFDAISLRHARYVAIVVLKTAKTEPRTISFAGKRIVSSGTWKTTSYAVIIAFGYARKPANKPIIEPINVATSE